MNEPVRIVADYLTGTTSGSVSLTTILAAVPRYSGDSAVSAPTIYDSTRHAFLARGIWPQATDTSVVYPAVGVRLMDATYSTDERPQPDDAGFVTEGDCTIAIGIVVDLQDPDEAAEDIGYLVRGVLNCLRKMNRGPNAHRELNGFLLKKSLSLRVETPPVEQHDKRAMAVIFAAYKTMETTYS